MTSPKGTKIAIKPDIYKREENKFIAQLKPVKEQMKMQSPKGLEKFLSPRTLSTA